MVSQYVDHSETVDSKIPSSHIRLAHETSGATLSPTVSNASLTVALLHPDVSLVRSSRSVTAFLRTACRTRQLISKKAKSPFEYYQLRFCRLRHCTLYISNFWQFGLFGI